MRNFITILMILSLLVIPVSATELTAPAVPESAEKFMPTDPQSLGQGILEVLKEVTMRIRPDLKEASGVCLGILAAAIVLCITNHLQFFSKKTAVLAGALLVGILILENMNSMIRLGSQTVSEISEYGKLLLPVMTTALAAQGGVSASTALYAGTAVFDAILSALISKLLVPMIYLFLTLCISCAALEDDMLKKVRDLVRSASVWMLKTILYVFTGYISLTGIISGSTDAMALKAAKMTISGVVPVVGGILSDASEAVLVGAGTVKNAAGLYGMFAIIAIWVGPFVKIGVHYLMLKGPGILCAVFSDKQFTELVQDISSAMGMLLAMTGTVCLMLMISMVCFMKGMG